MDNIRDLLIKAKNKDKLAIEFFIDKYFRLAIYLSKNIFLHSFTKDDINQIGMLSILIAIDKFDINNDISKLNNYMYFTIRNNYNFLIKNNIKANSNIDYISYSNKFDNIINDDEINLELVAFGLVCRNEDIEILREAIKTLKPDELKIINYVYLDNKDNDKTRTVIEYSRLNKMNTRKCYRIKDRAMSKLNKYFLNKKNYLN